MPTPTPIPISVPADRPGLGDGAGEDDEGDVVESGDGVLDDRPALDWKAVFEAGAFMSVEELDVESGLFVVLVVPAVEEAVSEVAVVIEVGVEEPPSVVLVEWPGR
jgi:hypothetical protein